ncbi:mannitol dehydrogenase [Sphingomonas metalli]|uniref:Mannitol dehydrogenase n=1 Tax=Sphingomonas metalli TaxID=1779358 RepID=A0A916T0H6_9SPHN|nr:mannitol dehydrogenase family protein [Sphingomonas metalli]GGB22986.1 mannitol dehydrogenase [Sphingomonas metalli]
MRLSDATAGTLPDSIAWGGYDRHAQRRGIVHLGIGAFHRAHQAWYTDAAMAAGDRDWAITGVSLRSPQVRAQLAPQDGLYTVSERGPAGEAIRLVEAVRAVLVAPSAPDAVAEALADPDTKIVTLTVTEKGYARRPDSPRDPAAHTAGPRTIYDYLGEAVIARHDRGAGPLTLISCDNLAANGATLRAGLAEWLDAVSPRHRAWFEQGWACPATMVDRIVPATMPADLDRVAAATGLRDEGAVVTEAYAQWVIEDRFAGPRPRWDVAGAQFVADVRPFETAKLRMLNGAHSALACLGLARDHRFVHEAIADPAIRPLVERLMRAEAAPSVAAAPGQDLARYADLLLTRFANPALPHRLAQIATDGSQKIGPRWLEALADNRAAGRDSPATLTALAAWTGFVRAPGAAADPMAETLAARWAAAGREGIVDALFGPAGLFGAAGALADAERAFVTARLEEHRAD